METSQPSAVVVFSGGLDSTTCVYDAIDQGYKVDLVSFNYGQRHKKELDFAKATAVHLNLRHDVVDLSGLTPLLAESGSSLVSVEEVPEGHYAEETMKATIVPNRNMMMLSIATAIAVSRKIEYVITGVHSGDHAIYPDCRPQFIGAVDQAALLATNGSNFYGIFAPYASRSKADIARRAIILRVPLEKTWSCYKGDETHCGRCGTCVERLEAIHEAVQQLRNEGSGFVIDGTYQGETRYKLYEDLDPTEYQDSEFWMKAIDDAAKEDK
jgi:7-cyano-7-deazaguanine synthase